MKRFFLILATTLIMMVLACVTAHAAPAVDNAIDEVELPSVMKRAYAGYYHFVEAETGDTLIMLVFNPIIVYPPERFRNKDDEKLYWKTVRDVKKALPYAKLLSSTLLETYEYLDTYQTEKEKQAYLKQFEKDMFNQYKPQMKKLTKNQGKLLIKLINRETNQSSYSILKAFLGTFRAGFWQTFSKFFGASLKAGYHPNKDKKDAMIERICVQVEQGTL